MNRNNINLITNDGNTFKYVVSIEDWKEQFDFLMSVNVPLGPDATNVSLITSDEVSYIKRVNEIIPYEGGNSFKCSSCAIKLHFPEYKPELFVDDMNYLVEIFLNIETRKVLLHSGIHSFLENVANENIFRLNETDYYEYFKIIIPSPYEVLFSDNFQDFRESIGDIEHNITSSVLNVVITPLDDNQQIHSYINFGTTCLPINNGDDSYLLPILSTNVNSAFNEPLFQIDWRFNNQYEQTNEGLAQYFKETYFLDNYVTCYEFLIYDKETNVYKDFIEYDLENNMHYEFDTNNCILGWELLNQSLMARCKVQLIDIEEYNRILQYNETKGENDPDFECDFLIELNSSEIALIPETYKFFAQQTAINNIDLRKQKMNNYTFNIVNKVNKQVINLERPTDYKANIIKPVFYKVKDLGTLNLNPEVTENICVNLDAYKSKTKYFFIQIEGVIFNQIGSISAGIVFNVIGNKLPNKEGEGNYYILNSDKEMITSGKYKYNNI